MTSYTSKQCCGSILWWESRSSFFHFDAEFYFFADADRAFYFCADPDPLFSFLSGSGCGHGSCSTSKWCKLASKGIQTLHGSILTSTGSGFRLWCGPELTIGLGCRTGYCFSQWCDFQSGFPKYVNPCRFRSATLLFQTIFMSRARLKREQQENLLPYFYFSLSELQSDPGPYR
jgi:hypothetical protein